VSHEQTIRVVIHGKVQGVWYRAWTTEEARELGLDGWVRNRRDGTVEAVFAGPRADVARMLELCREGPPLARVDRIDEHPESGPVPPGFEQKPTI
jgi:acylphosphatase